MFSFNIDLVFLFLISQFFISVNAPVAPKLCNANWCNNAGACTLENNKANCRCIGKYFQGSNCKEIVDHCSSNPCKNGATCTNSVGQFLCGKCPPGFGGQQCSVRNVDSFSNLHVLINPVWYYGARQQVVLTLETLGTALFVYEIFTENLFIDTFETKPKQKNAQLRFSYSTNLRSVAWSQGLWHAYRLPYNRGYYHISSTALWQVGDVEVTARVADEQFRALHEQLFTVHVVQPSHLPCVPVIRYTHGNNPQEPLMLDIARFNLFEGIIVKRCAKSSQLETHWTIHNSIGTVQLYDFGSTPTLQLKIRPYRLWFNFHGEIMQSYMLRLHVVEHYHEGTVHAEATCYMFVMSKPIYALILGGETREVSASQSFVLDGSCSRDFALAPTAKQEMRITWDCTSTDDPKNRFCRKGLSRSISFTVPAHVLQIGKTYNFKLTVSSIVNLNENSRTTQVIKVVGLWQHSVAIHCARNCFAGKFSADKKVHLIVSCSTCTNLKNAQIEWTQDGGGKLGEEHRVSFKPPGTNDLNVEVTVKSGGFSGKASIKLKKNDPPSGGSCSIKPTSGVEFQTEFIIECTNYQDLDAPISFQYIAGTFALDRTNERLMHARLPQTGELKIVICDFLSACTETMVSVSVSAMPAVDSKEALQKFLQKDESSLVKLLQDGEVEHAIVLANALTKSAKTLEIATVLRQQLMQFPLLTMLEVEQLTFFTRNLIDPLQPLDNKKVALFADIFKQIATGFEHVVTDGEVREILPSAYEGIINQVDDMVAEFSEKLEEIPQVQRMLESSSSAEDPLAEEYPPIPDFDETVLQRVENWLNVIDQSFKCFHYIGIAGTITHVPGDEHFKLERKGTKTEVFSIDKNTELQIKPAGDNVLINMTTAVLTELQHKLKDSRVLLQVMDFNKNPFWWYPDEHPIDTKVVYFSAFSSADLSKDDYQLTHPFVFRLKLTMAAANEKRFKGHIKAGLDMPIYRIAIPKFSVLTVKISETSTPVRVMLRLDSKPRGYEVRRTSNIAPTKDTYHVVNRGGEDSNAYLAAMAATTSDSEQTFEYSATLQKCVSWSFTERDPQWVTTGCVPQLDASDKESITCHCYHLSVFAGKVHNSDTAESSAVTLLLEQVPFNWYMLWGYLLLLLLLVLLFWWAYCSHRKRKATLLTAISYGQYKQTDYKLILHLTTGGQWNAGTSANVSVNFVLKLQAPTPSLSNIVRKPELKEFLIVQNPERPHLGRNTTCTLKLPLSANDLARPLLLYVSRDNAGRYPSWYCRRIVIEDEASGLIYVFQVERWITNAPLKLDGQQSKNAKPQRMAVFQEHLERKFILGFQNQSTLGPWKHGSLAPNSFERICIWTVKLMVCICVVAVYYGATTIETYEEDRELYNEAIFSGLKILLLCVICYVICSLVELLILFFIFYVK